MNLDPLWLSLKIASISSVVVFIVGTFLARLLSRRHFKGKNLFESAILLPMVLPPTVVGFGLLYLFGNNGLVGKWLLSLFGMQLVFTWYAAVIASVIVSFPLMYQSAAAAFKNYNTNLENAAYTMGASKVKVFWTISLPLAWPGLLAGLVLAFSRALGEFGATLMFAGYIPGETDTLPIAIYFAVEAGNSEAAIWLVLIMVAIGFGTVYWLNRWNRRQSIWITEAKDDKA